MTLYKFKDFIDNLIVENLHPELRDIVSSPNESRVSKQSRIAKKIKDLTDRGESTGIEGNMPKGSSRAYLKHKEKTPVSIDGRETTMETGTKVAIRGNLDKHHDKSLHEGLSLGALQNKVEHDDWFTNKHRVLVDRDRGGFKTNEDGIFPPLLDKHENHEWSHVGHARDIKAGEFRKLTKNDTHPSGISHKDFVSALIRSYNRQSGRHWSGSPEEEKHMHHVSEHPLVDSFITYHSNTGSPPHDYQQLKNLGIWKHPITNKEYIVARDHGFDSTTQKAYGEAFRNKFNFKTF